MLVSNIAYNGLMHIAYATHMDWFEIRTKKGEDYVYDNEAGVYIPLQKGLKDFAEGITDPWDDYVRPSTSKEEIYAARDLFKELGIKTDYERYTDFQNAVHNHLKERRRKNDC